MDPLQELHKPESDCICKTSSITQATEDELEEYMGLNDEVSSQ